jgi:hypothetical protein
VGFANIAVANARTTTASMARWSCKSRPSVMVRRVLQPPGMRIPAVVSSIVTLGLGASIAAAEPLATSRTAAPTPSFELGVRVGGYGFRRDGDPRPGRGWTECQMNGFGVFGGRTLTGPLFVEAGLDLYASGVAAEPSDLPIDRTSGLISAAIGARTQLASWVRAYVQLGAGLELTRVSVPYGEERIRDHKAMPDGFFGAGVDLRVARGTYVGTTFRGLVMGNFDYDAARLDMDNGWVAAPSSTEVFDPSPGVAAQVQFYARRDL